MQKRIVELKLKEASKANRLIKLGRLKSHRDNDGFITVDDDELKAVKPIKTGRPPKESK